MKVIQYLSLFLCRWLRSQQDTILLIMKELQKMDKAKATDKKPVREAVRGTMDDAVNEAVNEAVGEARGGCRSMSVPSFPHSRFFFLKFCLTSIYNLPVVTHSRFCKVC